MSKETNPAYGSEKTNILSRSLAWIATHYQYDRMVARSAWENSRPISEAQANAGFICLFNRLYAQNADSIESSHRNGGVTQVLHKDPFTFYRSEPGADRWDIFYQIDFTNDLAVIGQSWETLTHIKLDTFSGARAVRTGQGVYKSDRKLRPAALMNITDTLMTHLDPSPDMLAAIEQARQDRNNQ